MNKLPFEKSDTAKEIASFNLPRFDQLPKYEIFMGQLITILDEYLSVFLIPGEEKILTHSMINNYVYNNIIRAPIKKKYSRRQIVHLLVIGILKQVLSISEIADLVNDQIEDYGVDKSYNFFCDELENALKVTFGTRSFSEIEKKEIIKTPLSENVRSAVLSVANKIYVKKSLYYDKSNTSTQNFIDMRHIL